MEILKSIEDIKDILIFPLPFDFKVILNDEKYFLIEYQGRQHYDSNSWFSDNLENIQKRDSIKYEYMNI